MGAVTSAAFALRNTDKTFRGGEGTRGSVAGAQFFNTVDALKDMEGAGKIKTFAQNIFDKTDELAKKVSNSKVDASKLGKVTQKIVNPLLCVASGARVLKDKDKDKALTEEVCAMGAMFGTERVMKVAREAAYKAVKNGSLEGITKNQTMQKYGDIALKKIKGIKSKGGKTALFIAAELLFVVISVAAFDQGKKFGKFLTGRNEDAKTPDKKQVDYKS